MSFQARGSIDMVVIADSDWCEIMHLIGKRSKPRQWLPVWEYQQGCMPGVEDEDGRYIHIGFDHEIHIKISTRTLLKRRTGDIDRKKIARLVSRAETRHFIQYILDNDLVLDETFSGIMITRGYSLVTIPHKQCGFMYGSMGLYGFNAPKDVPKRKQSTKCVPNMN